MHIAETFSHGQDVPTTKVMTFDGEARSGKGTSVAAVEAALVQQGRSAMVIDQGLKFRSLTRHGLSEGLDFNDTDKVNDFLLHEDTRFAMLDLLGHVATLDEGDKKSLLYGNDVNSTVSFIGASEHSHPLAINLLFEQVQNAVVSSVDAVLIDGRCMDKYGKQIAEQQLAQYVIGFYFRCDVAIAARRSQGIFVDIDQLTKDQKLKLFETIVDVSDRNRRDALRETDPMREPHNAYSLDLAEFNLNNARFVGQQTLRALHSGIVSVDTSYTKSVAEMTEPVVAIATQALDLQDAERERFAEDPELWACYEPYNDPQNVIVSGLPDLAPVLRRTPASS